MVGSFVVLEEGSCASWDPDQKPHADSAQSFTRSFSSASTHSGEPCPSDVDDGWDSCPEFDMINVHGLDENWEAVLLECQEYCKQLDDVSGCLEGNDVDDGPLDAHAFVNFGPLLALGQEYARASGCRFQKSCFAAINVKVRELMQSGIDRLDSATLAKLRLVPAILEIFPRIRRGEVELIEELIRAVDLMMGEAARNGMICTLKANDLWPPEIGGYDVSGALSPTFAKLHRSESERTLCAADALHIEKRLALTASFIVEFAEAVGLTMSPLADLRQHDLNEFNAQVSEMVSRRTSKGNFGFETSCCAKSVCRTSLSKSADVPVQQHDKSDVCVRRWDHVSEECRVETSVILEEFLRMPVSTFFTQEEETRMLEDLLAAMQ